MRRYSFAAFITLMGAGAAWQVLAAGGAEPTQAAAASDVRPLIDNERVAVWDTTRPLPAAGGDFVAISFKSGTAAFGHAGDKAAEGKERTIVIDLKNYPVAPIPNNSGYPDAYPRPHIEKLLENERVIVWRYRWNLGEPTPMHFHSRDVVVVYLEDTALKSTAPDGKSVLNEYKSGDIRFNRRDRVHTETLVRDAGSAVITELK
jgi:hypothetical protein